ncbi:S41 family peptidase [Aureisphaera galaxeae]|uniref:S41 family peptidase n=1 Tax=Aureisphaera galaxeae TaxID=1538023 RepID=UPI00234FBC33|nr:S41 family peptidase [Aureisphaera galaxeae]MDC8005408.1 S41 family peptidase [Aureisphaera galaxeae]
MRKILPLILLCLMVTACAQTNPEVKKTLDQIIAHAETHSQYRETVNWDELKAEIYEMAKEADSVSDLGPALNHLLKSLGDTHARVFHNNQILAYNYGDLKEHHVGFESEIYNEIQQVRKYPFMVQMIDDDIGYIRIVGLPMGDNEAMSKEIQEPLCELIRQGAHRWIVDLRYNGGGNMNPMGEGLAPLFGNGVVGGTKGLIPEQDSVWEYIDGSFHNQGYSVQLGNGCPMDPLPKVAVLSSIYTASSGEVLVVMFRERKNTRSFGQKTNGMVTATDWTVIDDKTAMTISVGYYNDKKGNVYKEYVDVDEEFPFVAEPLTDNDITLQRAVEWLNEE